MQETGKFNIRVYGLLINENNEILLVHEKRNGFEFTKFPGGGLEFGEGTKDCLIREFKEEININVEIIDHFYTTDFFQPSLFDRHDQIISIYYLVNSVEKIPRIDLHERIIKSGDQIEILNFNWKKLSDLNENNLTLPIDKVVCKMLLKEIELNNK